MKLIFFFLLFRRELLAREIRKVKQLGGLRIHESFSTEGRDSYSELYSLSIEFLSVSSDVFISSGVMPTVKS